MERNGLIARNARPLAWAAFALAAVLSAAAIVIAARNHSLGVVPPTASSLQTNVAATAGFGIILLSFSLVGALIVSRQPDNGLGWLFCANGVVMAFSNLSSAYEAHALLTNPGSLPGGVWFGLLSDALWVPFLSMTSVFLFLLFPEGRPVGRARRVASGIALGAVAVATIGGLLEPTLYSFEDIPNPLGVPASPNLNVVLSGPALLVVIAVLLFAVANLFVRFRGARGEERLQFRWFAYSTLLIVVLLLPSMILDSVPPLLVSLSGVALLSMPIAIGIAISKHRLYEIDVVIKKTVVYGILAGLIAILGLTILFFARGVIARPLKHRPDALILVGVVLGVLVWPLRSVAKRLAERLVFRGRASAYEVLTSFAGRLGETYSSEDVLSRMARVLAEGSGASRARVWLRVGDGWRLGGSSTGEPFSIAGSSLPLYEPRFDVRHHGELLGALTVSMPANDPMNPSKEALINDLASQAGLVLRNVRLLEDLRESRRRIVTVQDERARKLERNIHDGAQQQLVALAVKVRLADGLVGLDKDRAHIVLEELQRDVTEAIENLRDLARGIYPPLLADQGLAAALEAQARKSAVPVTVDSDGIGRYPSDIEAAVYFCCLEALQNVAKYANASSATVRLAALDGELTFEVTDDGRGFDSDATPSGTGLQGIADRLAALGGEVTVRSIPGTGTTVSGTLRVESGR